MPQLPTGAEMQSHIDGAMAQAVSIITNFRGVIIQTQNELAAANAEIQRLNARVAELEAAAKAATGAVN
jgi:polyhydroxyalkanoate synthesis regulator phasin